MSIIQVVRKNPKRHDRREPVHDFLKYWRVVRYWALKKYGLTTGDLDLLLYLYSCPLFSKEDYRVFDDIMPWNKRRFDTLLRDGWIMKWRASVNQEKALYQVSYKTKNIITGIYKKLLGEEHISEDRRTNPIFKNSTAGYADKVNRRAIKHMNKEYGANASKHSHKT